MGVTNRMNELVMSTTVVGGQWCPRLMFYVLQFICVLSPPYKLHVGLLLFSLHVLNTSCSSRLTKRSHQTIPVPFLLNVWPHVNETWFLPQRNGLQSIKERLLPDHLGHGTQDQNNEMQFRLLSHNGSKSKKIQCASSLSLKHIVESHGAPSTPKENLHFVCIRVRCTTAHFRKIESTIFTKYIITHSVYFVVKNLMIVGLFS